MKNILSIIFILLIVFPLSAQEKNKNQQAQLRADPSFSDIQLQEGNELFNIDANDLGQLVFRRNGSQTDETYVFDDGLRRFYINDASNVAKIDMQVTSTSYGFLGLNGTNGNANFRLTTISGDNDSGYFGVYNADGSVRVAAYSSSSNAGRIETKGPNGNDNVRFSSLGTNVDHGYLAVIDASNTAQAGAYVNVNGDGIVFGDVKSFRVDHPTQPDKHIWYACVEGPEVATYNRGTAQLVNGEAFISFPEHFALLANPGSMTVSVTPLDSDTYGLAVTEKTATGFKVVELKRGSGNFAFDWEVKCVRKGYEDFEVVRDKNSDAHLDDAANPNEPDTAIPGDTESSNN